MKNILKTSAILCLTAGLSSCAYDGYYSGAYTSGYSGTVVTTSSYYDDPAPVIIDWHSWRHHHHYHPHRPHVHVDVTPSAVAPIWPHGGSSHPHYGPPHTSGGSSHPHYGPPHTSGGSSRPHYGPPAGGSSQPHYGPPSSKMKLIDVGSSSAHVSVH